MATASAPSGSSADQLAALIQALQQRQIPALPQPAAPAPAPAPPAQPASAAATGGQPDALALLRMILTNPQLQQALQSGGAGPARTVQLPVPTHAAARPPSRPVPIPLGAVLNAIVALAGQSMTELAEQESEDAEELPEYLVAEDGELLVDPASADDRAALVTHLFRLSDAGRRSRRSRYQLHQPGSGSSDRDESDSWARAAGFL